MCVVRAHGRITMTCFRIINLMLCTIYLKSSRRVIKIDPIVRWGSERSGAVGLETEKMEDSENDIK